MVGDSVLALVAANTVITIIAVTIIPTVANGAAAMNEITSRSGVIYYVQ
jgi:hypothetical protein